MNCIVTAGPTFEPVDEVRRLTNFSTGRLGAGLANCLADRGHTVTLLLGEMATWTGTAQAQQVIRFTTTRDLQTRLAAFAGPSVDAVFHAAAVSDFACARVWERLTGGELRQVSAKKIPSRAGPMLVELEPTPKLIGFLRQWFPTAVLIGWKYEVEGTSASAVAHGAEQIRTNRTEACVVNGPAYGTGFGLVASSGRVLTHCDQAEALYAALENAGLRQRAGSALTGGGSDA